MKKETSKLIASIGLSIALVGGQSGAVCAGAMENVPVFAAAA